MQKLGPIKRIITMTNEWFTNEKYKRNCIDMIRDAGYETEIWNVNKVVFRAESIPDVPNDLYQGEVPVKNFESREELSEELRKCRYDSLILNWYADWSATVDICAEKVRYCNMACAPMLADRYLNSLDGYYKKRTLFYVIKQLWAKINGSRRNQEQAIIKQWPPIYNFAATPAEYTPVCRLSPKNKMRFIHHIDYDKYILDKNRVSKDDGYILFVDEAWGIHPENSASDWTFLKEEIKYYYELMDRLFTMLEQHYNKKVIIASHPKSQYSGNEFKDREIRQFQTYELIKNSSFVIHHISSSVGWSFLFDKPCLPVTYKKMREYMGKDISIFATYCGLRYYDLEDDGAPWNFMFYNKNVYQKYLHDFVVMDRNDTRLYMEVVLDEINKV